MWEEIVNKSLLSILKMLSALQLNRAGSEGNRNARGQGYIL